MRIYRRYRCEFGHEFTTRGQQGVPPAHEARCPDGHAAVTVNEEAPADEVQVVLRPAARVVDRVTGRIWNSDRYYLVLLDREDRPVLESTGDYSWDEVIELAALFRGKTLDSARKWWERRAP